MMIENEGSSVAEPKVDHRITMTFQGDWGQANFHRVCGWLSQEIVDRSAPGSRIFIRSGRGAADAIDAVLSGDVDVAIMTPAAAAGMIAAGVGPFASGGAKRLRALGTLPQRDRLVTCVDAELGISSMSEFAERLAELRIATSPDDGENAVGLAAHRQLLAVGIEPAAVWEAGGKFLYSQRPFPAIAAFREGAANVLIQEAIMTPAWQRINANKRITYLDATPDVLDVFAEWHWPSARVEKGYLPELDRDLTALDFSDFVLLCTEDLPSDVASLTAWCFVATRDALESQYRHIPSERSPITYPLEPRAMKSAPIPLHPAVAQTYADNEADEHVAAESSWT